MCEIMLSYRHNIQLYGALSSGQSTLTTKPYPFLMRISRVRPYPLKKRSKSRSLTPYGNPPTYTLEPTISLKMRKISSQN